MDKYARLMQKLEIVNVEFFKGICQLFEVFFYFIFETFGHPNSHSNGKGFLSLSIERCAAADNISLVARILYRSKTIFSRCFFKTIQPLWRISMHTWWILYQILKSIYIGQLQDYFYILMGHFYGLRGMHVFARYVDRIANAKWEAQDLLLEYGLEIVAETLIEGLSRAYYLPETEYVHWASTHPEYTKTQIVGLINLVATMKGWKRKTRLEIIEKIEGADI
ncbi:hypothetical protein GH714_015221 [Hevea brasiliensis]|uniref:Syndetin C-terminal domain-containing protein n=1 Tax=Hevea brasiliensis TaxID=3981 RepID=A0A6A6LGW9_HEVBR|nr:hypothetical protein GH714_015221 [Hevea brasiliensis]